MLLTEEWLQSISRRVTASTTEETRSFRGANMPLLLRFFQSLEQGHMKVLGVRDFAYNDKRAGHKTLEREVWLLDTTQKDANGMYIAEHL